MTMKRLLQISGLLLLSLVTASAPTVKPTGILTGWCSVGSPNQPPTPSVGTFTNLGSTNTAACWNNDTLINGGTNDGVPMPSAGKLKNLRLIAIYNDTGSSPGTVSWPVTIQVFVNKTATALACSVTLTGSAGGSSGQAVTFTCADSVDVLTIAAGDEVVVEMSTPNPAFSYCNIGDPSCPVLRMSVAFEEFPL